MLPQIYFHLKWMGLKILHLIVDFPTWLLRFLLHLADYRCMKTFWRNDGITFTLVDKHLFGDLRLLTLQCFSDFRVLRSTWRYACRAKKDYYKGLGCLLFGYIFPLRTLHDYMILLLKRETDGFWETEEYYSEILRRLTWRVLRRRCSCGRCDLCVSLKSVGMF